MKPIKLASTVNMPRAKWFELRRNGIGGSEAAAICGLSKWSSPLDVYADKLGLSPDKPMTESMRAGNDLERYVADRFAEESNLNPRRSNYMFQHAKFPWMMANLDFVIREKNAILECKTTSDRSPIRYDKGEYDPAHYCQVQHYLAVMDMPLAYLAVFQMAGGLHWFRIERNEEDIAALIELEHKFWNDHVLKGNPPNPNGSGSTNEVLARMFPQAIRESVSLIGYESKLDERERLKAQIEALQLEVDAIDQKIKLDMGDAEIGFANGYKVSWANTAGRETIDTKSLRKNLPQVFEKYKKQGSPSRRFKVEKLESEELTS